MTANYLNCERFIILQVHTRHKLPNPHTDEDEVCRDGLKLNIKYPLTISI